MTSRQHVERTATISAIVNRDDYKETAPAGQQHRAILDERSKASNYVSAGLQVCSKFPRNRNRRRTFEAEALSFLIDVTMTHGPKITHIESQAILRQGLARVNRSVFGLRQVWGQRGKTGASPGHHLATLIEVRVQRNVGGVN